ncbi:MAG TPA: hypothetical protein VFK02_00895 [Kofleriaceae bacterium]|nr:hypothetical protein [Kofleriaceae bacterium]
MPPSLKVAPELGELRPAGVTPRSPATVPEAKEIDEKLQHCRDQVRAEHLAQTAFELAGVIDGTSEGNLQITDLGAPHLSTWAVGSYGLNSYRPSDAYTESDGSALDKAMGIQPTLMVRFDATRVMGDWKSDLFLGARLPVEWDWLGVFAETGITLGDLSKVQATSVQKTVRVGAGLDYRISNGSWLGVYVGEDFGDGASGFNLLSNVKFQLGERRQYGLH